MGLMIRFAGTVFYPLLYLHSRQCFNGLKYMYSVISVIVDSLPGNTKNRESTHSWTARFVHSIRPLLGGFVQLKRRVWHGGFSALYSLVAPRQLAKPPVKWTPWPTQLPAKIHNFFNFFLRGHTQQGVTMEMIQTRLYKPESPKGHANGKICQWFSLRPDPDMNVVRRRPRCKLDK